MICKIRLWKWACLSIGGSAGVRGGGGAHLPGTCERQVNIWRALSVGSRETCTRRLCKRTSLSVLSPSGKPGDGACIVGTLRDR